MRREDLKDSFDKTEPDKSAKIRMLDNILSHSGKEKKVASFNFRKVVPALGLAVVIVGSILAYDMMAGKGNVAFPDNVTDNHSHGREDMAAPLVNQFQLNDRHYMLLSDDLRAEYGFPQQINESDIGDSITTINKSVDPSLIGNEIYAYKPAGGEAVVAVKKDNAYQLFRFFTFESYNNNQDEDAIEYLKLYGINEPEDILKVQFIVYSEQSKIEGKSDIRGELTGNDEIAKFYGYYSVLKNSSDRYFERLLNYNTNTDVEVDSPKQQETLPPDAVKQDSIQPDNSGSIDPMSSQIDIAEDLPLILEDDGDTGVADSGRPVSTDDSKGMMDMGNTDLMVGAAEPSMGSTGDALANPVGIRIYSQSGVYFETMYYKNMGFISRYEVNKEFAGFIEANIR